MVKSWSRAGQVLVKENKFWSRVGQALARNWSGKSIGQVMVTRKQDNMVKSWSQTKYWSRVGQGPVFYVKAMSRIP